MSAAPKPETGTAVGAATKSPEEHRLAVINARLKRLDSHLEAVLPKFITPERMIRVTLLAINRQPELMNCSAESIAESMMTIATWGLEIGRTAHIVAYYDSTDKITKAQPQADYKGMIELAIRCGSITSCRARVVYERDSFDVEYGLTERLHHVPTWREDPGAPVGVYAVAGLPSGEQKFDLMSAADVAKIKARSKAGNKDKGPWKSDPAEMWKKTVVKRLLKMVPQNPLLTDALELDEDERDDTAHAVRSSLSRRHVADTHDGDGYEAPPRRGRNALANGEIQTTVVDMADRTPISRALPRDPYLPADEPEMSEEEQRAFDQRLAEEEG